MDEAVVDPKTLGDPQTFGEDEGEAPLLPKRELMFVLGSLLIGTLLAALDNTIVSAALPTIVGELRGFSSYAWVGTIYILTSTIATPILGKLSDIYGRKLILQSAVLVFTIGSVLCALAQSMSQLILFRGVQGLGAGGLQALTFAILADIIPARERGRYIGFYTGMYAIAAIAGPLVGGFMIQHFSWPWIFLVNVPLGIAALAALQINLRFAFRRRAAKVDFLGAVLLAGGLSSLMVGLERGRDGWVRPPVLGLLLAAVVLVGLFIAWQMRVSEPLVPMRLFANPIVAACFGTGIFLGAVMFGAGTFFPLFFQDARGVSPTAAGLFTLPIMAGVLMGSTGAGRVISRTGRYRLVPIFTLAGGTIGALAMALLLATDVRYILLILPMALMGLGGGSSFTTQSIAAQNAVDVSDLGVATATLNFLRTLGASIGLAMFGTVFTSTVKHDLPRRLPAGAARSSKDLLSLIREPKQIKALAPAVRQAVRDSISFGVSRVYLICVPLMIMAWICSVLVREIPLQTKAGLAMGHVEG